MDIYVFLPWLNTLKRLPAVYNWTMIFNHIYYEDGGMQLRMREKISWLSTVVSSASPELTSLIQLPIEISLHIQK